MSSSYDMLCMIRPALRPAGILAKLGEVGEPLSATDIAIEIEKKVDGVRKLVRKMVRDGELAKVGSGSYTRYALPEVIMEDEDEQEGG